MSYALKYSSTRLLCTSHGYLPTCLQHYVPYSVSLRIATRLGEINGINLPDQNLGAARWIKACHPHIVGRISRINDPWSRREKSGVVTSPVEIYQPTCPVDTVV